MYQKRKNMEDIMILLIDLLCITFCIGIAYWHRHHVFYGRNIPKDGIWQLMLVCGIFILEYIFCDFNRHFFRRGWLQELFSIIKSEVILAIVWVVVVFVIHRTDELARLLFIYFFITNTVCMFLAHSIFKLYMTRLFKYGRYSSRLLLVTTSSAVEDILENLIPYNEWNWLLKGIVLLDQPEGRSMDTVGDYPVVAGESDWMDYVVHNEIDEVFVAYPDSSHTSRIREWIRELEVMGIIVDVNIEEFDLFQHGNKALNRVGKYAVVTNTRNVIPFGAIVGKRVLDIMGSLVGLLLLGIATVFVAPAIRIESPGPIFFGQTRIGKNGRRFTFYKFRSMYEDAEKQKEKLMEQNEMQGLMFKMEEDPRITRVGRFLRRTSIDELPQFWNVLKGDMSLVGTRPPTEDEFVQYEAKHKCRLSMTPGMTGLWQVSGRSDITDFDEVIQLDMEYIDNWSLWKDIKILLLTVKIVILGRGSR